MYLTNLKLSNFKTYIDVDVEFCPNVNCLVGNNGVGKTNLLDAVYYLSFCKSCFNSVDSQNIRTGQTYYIDLELGLPEQAVIIPRGTFFQTTGGQWIFVMDKSGSKAYRRNIRIGRQNPQYYEVLEGLEPGERVVTSGYEAFKDNEVLSLIP